MIKSKGVNIKYEYSIPNLSKSKIYHEMKFWDQGWIGVCVCVCGGGGGGAGGEGRVSTPPESALVCLSYTAASSRKDTYIILTPLNPTFI